MAFKQLELKGKLLGPQKADIEPDFESKNGAGERYVGIRADVAYAPPCGTVGESIDEDDALLTGTISTLF